MLSVGFLNELTEDARQELWRQILREIGFEQDPRCAWPLKNHGGLVHPPREDILEYSDYSSRG